MGHTAFCLGIGTILLSGIQHGSAVLIDTGHSHIFQCKPDTSFRMNQNIFCFYIVRIIIKVLIIKADPGSGGNGEQKTVIGGNIFVRACGFAVGGGHCHDIFIGDIIGYLNDLGESLFQRIHIRRVTFLRIRKSISTLRLPDGEQAYGSKQNSPEKMGFQDQNNCIYGEQS